MAAVTRQAALRGETSAGQKSSTITAAETNVLKAAPGKVARVIVWDVGTTATLDIYDDPDSNDSLRWGWVSADGKGTFDLEIPMGAAIRIVTGGTFGKCTVVWS